MQERSTHHGYATSITDKEKVFTEHSAART
jgi:hypothetical protein